MREWSVVHLIQGFVEPSADKRIAPHIFCLVIRLGARQKSQIMELAIILNEITNYSTVDPKEIPWLDVYRNFRDTQNTECSSLDGRIDALIQRDADENSFNGLLAFYKEVEKTEQFEYLDIFDVIKRKSLLKLYKRLIQWHNDALYSDFDIAYLNTLKRCVIELIKQCEFEALEKLPISLGIDEFDWPEQIKTTINAICKEKKYCESEDYLRLIKTDLLNIINGKGRFDLIPSLQIAYILGDESLVDYTSRYDCQELQEWFVTLTDNQKNQLFPWIKKSPINSYAAFDLETSIHDDRIRQAAFSSILSTFDINTIEGIQNKDIQDFCERLKKYKIIIGHNIKEHDIPVLERRNITFEDNVIWDTMEWEMKINPSRYSYQLQTEHTAKQDTLRCLKLFESQKLRIRQNMELLNHLTIPEEVKRLIESGTSNEENSNCSGDEFFRQENNVFSDLQIEDNSLILAPKRLWPILAQYTKAGFPTADDFHYKKISPEKINKITADNNDKARLMKEILTSYIKTEDNPLVIKLSKAVQNFITDNNLEKIIEDKCNTPIICTDSLGLQSIDCDAMGIKRIYQIGSISGDSLACYPIGTPISLPTLQQVFCAKSFSIMSSRLYPIEEEDFKKLDLDYPQYATNSWLRQEGNKYQAYYNFDLSKTTDIKPGVEYKTIELKNGAIHIVTSKSANNDIFSSRVNSGSPKRAKYWVYQFLLIKGLLEEIKDNKVIVLYVSNDSEIEAVKKYAKHLNFFIPDDKLSLQRKIEICNERKHKDNAKPMVVTNSKDLTDLCQAQIDQPYCLIWDSLNLDDLRIMWRGHFDKSADNDVDDLPSPRSCFLKIWPIIKSYSSLIAYQHNNNDLYLLDPATDYLDEDLIDELTGNNEDEIISIKISINKNDYEEKVTEAEKFFNKPGDNENSSLNVDDIMENKIRPLFIGNNSWTNEQKDALPIILRREKNTMVIIPTGGGKSVIFQGPILYRASQNHRLSIVITPLIALMSDHVNKLHSLGFYNVESLDSGKNSFESNLIHRKISGGEINLLFVAPERFRSRRFNDALLSRIQADNGLDYIVFDEAHCISQWGLDFRPQYRYVAERCKDFSTTPIELFSATITSQVKDDIQAVTGRDICCIGDLNANPIRSHIQMSFIPVSADDEKNQRGKYDRRISIHYKISSIVDDLSSKHFNPDMSRVVVFCKKRDDTKKATKFMKNILKEKDRENIGVDFFHADRKTRDKETIIDKYKKGEIAILFTTKAFGMGMDIPNIHYVYHLDPPDYIEDYLQEVGRAGRNEQAYRDAGFSEKKPIQAICYISEGVFERHREIDDRNSITWDDIKAIYDAVKDFIGGFQSNEKNPWIVVNSDIWRRPNPNPQTIQTEKAQIKTNFMLGLYWLEKNGLIKQGYNEYNFLDIQMADFVDKDETDELYKYILSVAGPDCAGQKIQISRNEFLSQHPMDTDSFNNHIINGARKNLYSLPSTFRFKFTQMRSLETKYIVEYNNLESSALEIMFTTVKDLLRNEISEIQPLTENALPEPLPWYSPTPRAFALSINENNRLQKVVNIIISLLSGVTVSKEMGAEGYKVTIVNSSKNIECQLNALYNNCFNLLKALCPNDGVINTDNEETRSWVEVMGKANIQRYSDLCNAIVLLKKIGYITVIASDITKDSGIEVKIEKDKQMIKTDEDFETVTSLKQVRKELMKIFCQNTAEKQKDKFIIDYFKCSTLDDYKKLLNSND